MEYDSLVISFALAFITIYITNGSYSLFAFGITVTVTYISYSLLARALPTRSRSKSTQTHNRRSLGIFQFKATSSNMDHTVDDVALVKQLLMDAGSLPLEIVDLITDHAEYWASSYSSIDYTNSPNGPTRITGSSGGGSDRFLIRSPPLGLTAWQPEDHKTWTTASLPAEFQSEHTRDELLQLASKTATPNLTNPCRKVVFSIRSHDQGWGGDPRDHGSYHGSWTWFDAGLDRFDASVPGGLHERAIRAVWPHVAADEDGEKVFYHELLHEEYHTIRCNQTATGQQQHHRIEWRWDDDINPESLESPEAQELKKDGRGMGTANGEFIRNMKLGDMVTVWGRARFPSWVNVVESVEVKVYWAV